MSVHARWLIRIQALTQERLPENQERFESRNISLVIFLATCVDVHEQTNTAIGDSKFWVRHVEIDGTEEEYNDSRVRLRMLVYEISCASIWIILSHEYAYLFKTGVIAEGGDYLYARENSLSTVSSTTYKLQYH